VHVKRFAIFAVLVAALVGARVAWSADTGRLVWIGTYTAGTTSKGIYTARFDEKTGALSPMQLAAATPNPSFLALHPNGKFLYAVNETSDGPEHSGLVTAFAIDASTGTLTELNHQLSRGADPCHLAVDATGRFLVVANYSSGSFAEFPIGADGRLGTSMAVLTHTGSGPNKDRQEGPHAHDVVFDKDNRHLVAVDLGLDQVFIYNFDAATGALTPAATPSAHVAPGAGPRHFAFHPDGQHAFSINEMGSTITTFTWSAADGRLTPGQSVSTLPAGFSAESTTAELAIDRSGRVLYGSNRGHDSLAVFAVGANASLSLVQHVPTRGKTPRNFALDPSGHWVIAANQQSNSLAVFAVDGTSGRLTPAGDLVTVGSPVDVLFR
jgi:6-phosphogluconolactonase